MYLCKFGSTFSLLRISSNPDTRILPDGTSHSRTCRSIALSLCWHLSNSQEDGDFLLAYRKLSRLPKIFNPTNSMDLLPKPSLQQHLLLQPVHAEVLWGINWSTKKHLQRIKKDAPPSFMKDFFIDGKPWEKTLTPLNGQATASPSCPLTLAKKDGWWPLAWHWWFLLHSGRLIEGVRESYHPQRVWTVSKRMIRLGGLVHAKSCWKKEAQRCRKLISLNFMTVGIATNQTEWLLSTDCSGMVFFGTQDSKTSTPDTLASIFKGQLWYLTTLAIWRSKKSCSGWWLLESLIYFLRPIHPTHAV